MIPGTARVIEVGVCSFGLGVLTGVVKIFQILLQLDIYACFVSKIVKKAILCETARQIAGLFRYERSVVMSIWTPSAFFRGL